MVMLSNSGEWLKSADANNGDVITFRDEGAWQENKRFTYDDGNPKMDFVVSVAHNEVDKPMRLNATNRTTLIDAYGKDTAAWVGKTATIEKVKALIGGKTMDVVMLRVSKGSEELPF